jgi:dienelactone hydrolase
MITRRTSISLISSAFMATSIGAHARSEDEGPLPERATFPSGDGRTTLVGYVWVPAKATGAKAPGVVMMHARAGAYSERAKGAYNARTLSLRHKAWGRVWAAAGYVAVLVDGFGPRGYPGGFPRFSYESRPTEVNEVAVRPLDAYGTLTYMRSRPDVLADRIGLMGWSNGGSATIASMSVEAPGITSPTASTGFRAALAFYPACGLKGAFDKKPFRPYAPTLVLHGAADEEVSYRRCQALVNESRANGGTVEIVIYQGAEHSFDSPGRKRQQVAANAEATDDAVKRSLKFFAQHVAGR